MRIPDCKTPFMFFFIVVSLCGIANLLPVSVNADAYSDAYNKMRHRLPDDDYVLKRNGITVNSSDDCQIKWGCTTANYGYFGPGSGSDDRDSHQYITLSSSSINDGPSKYRYATTSEFFVYTRKINGVLTDKDLNFYLVNRGIGADLACKNKIRAFYYKGLSTNPIGNPLGYVVQTGDNTPDKGCKKSYSFPADIPREAFGRDDELAGRQNSTEVTVNGQGTGIYQARVVLKFDNGNDPNTQSSLRLSVGGGARLGYVGIENTSTPSQVPESEHTWINSYPTNYGLEHKVRYYFRPKCTTPPNTPFLLQWDDLNNGSEFQPSNVTAKLWRFIPGQLPSSGSVALNINFPGPNYDNRMWHTENYAPNQPYAYMLEFDNINGGNGISFSHPFDSADARVECPAPLPSTAPPKLAIDTQGDFKCTTNLAGWAYDQDNPGVPLWIHVYETKTPSDANSRNLVGIFATDKGRKDINQPPGNDTDGLSPPHGFDIPIPETFVNQHGQTINLHDGQDHTFYVYAIDSNGEQTTGPEAPGDRGAHDTHEDNGTPGPVAWNPGGQDPRSDRGLLYGWNPVKMIGCGDFTLEPGATSNGLHRSAENPSSYSGSTSVTASFENGWGGPADGIQLDSAQSDAADYWYVKNNATYPGYPRGLAETKFKAGKKDFPHESIPVTGADVVAGNRYCIKSSVRPGSGIVDRDGTILTRGPGKSAEAGCDTVHNKPFVKVYDSAVSARSGFKSDQQSDQPPASCPGGTGTLASWNDNSGTYNVGSGTELSALALIKIVGFASAQPIPVPAGGKGYDLSFANKNVEGPTSDKYSPVLGGSYAATANADCVTAFEVPTAGGVSTVPNARADLPTGEESISKYRGNITLTSGDIELGTKRTIYVDGNVFINSNIKYRTGVPWTIDNVPSFALKVTGNIYVSPDVTELDGTYIAAKGINPGANGHIYTCGKSTFQAMDASTLYSRCNKQLVVHGSFVANKVNLMRTFGSLRNEQPVGAGSQLDLQWRHPPFSETHCLLINEPYGAKSGEENENETWTDNYLCYPPSLQMQWTCDSNSSWTPANLGTLPECHISKAYRQANGYPHCYQWDARPEDPDTWGDNYLCSSTDLKLEFKKAKDASMECIKITEPNDPEGQWSTTGYWLCEPKASPGGIPAEPTCSNDGGPSPRVVKKTCAAEVFDFSPEIYLRKIDGNGPIQYDSITSLPPVL